MYASLLIYFTLGTVVQIRGEGTAINSDGGHFLRSIVAKLQRERSIYRSPQYHRYRYGYRYVHSPGIRRRNSPSQSVAGVEDVEKLADNSNTIPQMPHKNAMFVSDQQHTHNVSQKDDECSLEQSTTATMDVAAATTTSSQDFKLPAADVYPVSPAFNFSSLFPKVTKMTIGIPSPSPFLPTAQILVTNPEEDLTTAAPESILNKTAIIYVLHPNDLSNHSHILYSPILLSNAVTTRTTSKPRTEYELMAEGLAHDMPSTRSTSKPPMNDVADDNLIDSMLEAMKPYENQNNQQADQNAENPTESPLKKLSKDPLLLAMASFVSVAMVFMSAIIFLPKVITSPPEVNRLDVGHELTTLTKLATHAIKGDQCSERIACEVGRAMQSLQIGAKPIRFLEVILPESISKQLVHVRKALTGKRVCKFIKCKQISNAANKVAAKTSLPEKLQSVKVEKVQQQYAMKKPIKKPFKH